MARMQVLEPTAAGVELETNIQEDGTTALTWAVDTDNEYPNSGKEFLQVTKGAGAAVMTVTAEAPDPYDGGDLNDGTVTIPANETTLVAPLSPEKYNQLSGTDKGYTAIQFSEVTGLEVAVIRLP